MSRLGLENGIAHPITLFKTKNMVATQWLEEAVAYAEQQHLLCQQQRRQQLGEADEEADLSDKNSSDNKY